MPDGLFPLSHASNVSVVECNESGRYLVLHTDELGFKVGHVTDEIPSRGIWRHYRSLMEAV